MDHAIPTLRAIMSQCRDLKIAPIVLAQQARVALGDEIGEIVRAKISVILIGERPGLSVANSLGIYLTWNPHVGLTDAARNCLSNIHADGLTYEGAAAKLAGLIMEARRLELSGVGLKECSLPLVES